MSKRVLVSLNAILLGLLTVISLLAPSVSAAQSVQRPKNDNFNNARIITGASGRITDTNLGATWETDEEDWGRNKSGGASVWYDWSATASGEVLFNTLGSNFDTLLDIWKCTDECRLSNSDDDGNADLTSKLTLNAEQGEQYLIRIDGYKGKTGQIALAWGGPVRPPNDDLRNSQMIVGESGHLDTTNVNATKEDWESTIEGNNGGASVWLYWEPPISGQAELDTGGSGFDTLLAVYQASDAQIGNLLGSNDDSGESNDRTSHVTVSVANGQKYYVVVDGYDGKTGMISLQWKLTAPAGTGINVGQFATAGGAQTASCQIRVTAGSTLEEGEKTGPVKLDLCFGGFAQGRIDVQIIRPDGSVRPEHSVPIVWANEYTSWTFVIPPEDPPGRYVIRASQGNQVGFTSIDLVYTDEARILMYPTEMTSGATTSLYISGFPRNTQIILQLKLGERCPGQPRGFCFNKWKRVFLEPNLIGRGTYDLPLNIDPGEYALTYELTADHPPGMDPTVWFTIVH